MIVLLKRKVVPVIWIGISSVRGFFFQAEDGIRDLTVTGVQTCALPICAIERRSYPPGEHGRGRIKQSEYLLQLREKRKARRYYGLLEQQFRTYYEKASDRKSVV